MTDVSVLFFSSLFSFQNQFFGDHLADQIKRYGPQIVVNLINQSGYEGSVFNAFSQACKELNNPDVKSVSLDFADTNHHFFFEKKN